MVGSFLSEYDNPTTIKTWSTLLSELSADNGWNHPHDMTAAGITAWVATPRLDGKPRANNSVRQRIAVVRTFHDYCRRNNIPTPDCEHVLRRLRKSYPRLLGKAQGNREPNRLNRQQLTTLFDACSDGTWVGSRDQLLIRLLALGLRRSEAATLTWGAMKNDGRIATMGKMHRLREVFPGPTMTEMIQRWRRYYEANVGPAADEAPFLATFQMPAPGQLVGGHTVPTAGLSPNSVYHILDRRAKMAGVGHVAPHDLRRSLAKIMHDEGHTLPDIQSALGHAETSGAVTQACYIGPLENTGKIAAGGLVD